MQSILSRQPKGSVLLFTLVILILLALMGLSIMLRSRTELTVSHNTYQGRDAFQQADLTARLALFAGRILINSTSSDDLTSIIDDSTDGPYEVRLGKADLSLADIPVFEGIPTTKEMLDRYRQALQDPAFTPHILVSEGGREVGSAALAIYYGDPQASGSSLYGGGSYGSQGENSFRAYLVVSAIGQLPRRQGEAAAYYDATASRATHSIITVVYREIIVN